MDFTIEGLVVDDAVVLTVAGDLDLASAPKLAASLQDAREPGQPEVIIDASGIGFCDCAGLQGFFESGRVQPVRLQGLSLALRRVLELTESADRFDIVTSATSGTD